MTIGNFSEVVGSRRADNLVGSDLEVLYSLQENDILTTVEGSLPGGLATSILVGGSEDDRYQLSNNSTTIVIENGDSDNDVGQADGIGFFSDTSFSFEIDNGRHLFVGDTASNQYAFLIDWQVPENRLESFVAADGTFSYEEFANGFRDLPGYLGSVTWEQALVQEELDFERFGLAVETIDEAIAIVNTRSATLESQAPIGNFSEVLGTEVSDSLVGSDLQILYGLGENDNLSTAEGSLPGGIDVTILVGGSGDDLYEVNNNSGVIVFENGNSDNDVGRATGISFFSDTSLGLEIDNGRHLYVLDTESNQRALLVDWQVPENRLESFEAADGTFSYEEFANGFRDLPGYLGSVTWEEAIAQFGFDLERLGLSPETIDEAIAQLDDRSEALESNLIDLYRFRNTTFDTGSYIFVGEGERNAILGNSDLNQTFSLDGVTEDLTLNSAFVASATPEDDLLPFYRLRSLEVPGTYLFVSTEEYNAIFAADSDQQDKWFKEGLDADGIDIAEFYLYGVGANQGLEFNRFQNTQNNTFLYAGPEETAAIKSDPNLSGTFLDQGVAFEAFI
ncbi:MAG: hypothetical protein QNJ55_23725 [Xenococcus sp. MO_188.B8]|nr:hypothetical protein [Xenococcus sp. MO_188.B8]